MAYTSEVHGLLQSNLQGELYACLKGKDCKVYGSDRMIYVEHCNKVFYPDLTIVYGDEEFKLHKRTMKATLNPSILIEVTSPSTESEDRIDKWACYKTLKSLKQYIIVSHRKKAVEIFNRMDEGNKWLNTEITEDEDFVEIADCKIALKDIYNKVIV
jgi:Uma2 family endonuclease